MLHWKFVSVRQPAWFFFNCLEKIVPALDVGKQNCHCVSLLGGIRV